LSNAEMTMDDAQRSIRTFYEAVRGFASSTSIMGISSLIS
jgi:hypothetical protein